MYNDVIGFLFFFQYPLQSSLLYSAQSKRIRAQEKIITGKHNNILSHGRVLMRDRWCRRQSFDDDDDVDDDDDDDDDDDNDDYNANDNDDDVFLCPCV